MLFSINLHISKVFGLRSSQSVSGCWAVEIKKMNEQILLVTMQQKYDSTKFEVVQILYYLLILMKTVTVANISFIKLIIGVSVLNKTGITQIIGLNILFTIYVVMIPYKRILLDMENQPEEVAVDVIEKDLSFKVYPSLQLHTRDKFIRHVRNQGYDAKDVLWVASEKIHGSNFSIHYNGESAKYGRRNDFITKDIPVPCNNLQDYFNQSFYDAQKLVNKFHNKLQDIYETIGKIEPKLLKYAIYGQYFGGYWPEDHPNFINNNLKVVQQGISYSPNHEFFAFDIFIVTSDKVYWADVFDIPKLLKDNIRSVPVYTQGTFQQVFNVNTKIDSTIPQLLGLPKLQKNLIEGMVIRPNISLYSKHGQRVVIKKKNSQFLEMVNEPNLAKKEKKEKSVDPAIAVFLYKLCKYLNVNRIDSVVSKCPDLKDRNKLRELVTKDILSDAQKDEVKLPAIDDEKYKKLMQEFNAIVFKEINNYYVKH